MKKIVIMIGILGLLITASAYSYQFEDYAWGKPKNEIYQQIKQKGKNITSNSDTEIEYSDRIFDEPCRVGFIFTPKTKLLSTIGLKWQDTSIGSKLQELLTKKYGEPKQPNQFSKNFVWGSIEDEGILLDYDFMETQVYYFSVYDKMRKKEESEIASKEKNRF